MGAATWFRRGVQPAHGFTSLVDRNVCEPRRQLAFEVFVLCARNGARRALRNDGQHQHQRD